MATDYGYLIPKDNYGKSSNADRYKKIAQQASLPKQTTTEKMDNLWVESTAPNVLQKQNINTTVKPVNISDFVNDIKNQNTKQNVNTTVKPVNISDFVSSIQNSNAGKSAQLKIEADSLTKQIKQKEQEYNKANNISDWNKKLQTKSAIQQELNALNDSLTKTQDSLKKLSPNNDKLITGEQLEEIHKNLPLPQKIDRFVSVTLPETIEKTGRTAIDLGVNIASGATNAIEGKADVAVGNLGALASGVTSGFGLAPNELSEKIKKSAEDFVRFNFSGEELLEEKKNEGAGIYEPKILGIKVRDAVNTIANMVTSVAFGGPLGFTASAAGQNIEEALLDNQSLNRAVVYGDIAGAVEGLTEKMFDAVNLLGGGKFDEFLPKGAISKLIGGSAGEAIEEVVSEGINPFLKYLTYENGTYDMLSLVEYLNNLKDAAWNGFVIGLIMKGGQDVTLPEIREQYKEEIYTAVDKSKLPENVKETVKEVMITPAQAQINQDLQNLRNQNPQNVNSTIQRENITGLPKLDVQNQAQTQNIEQPNVTLPNQAKTAQNANMNQFRDSTKMIAQNSNLPTQKAQKTLQNAKIAGMTDVDMQKAIDLNNMLRSGANLEFYDAKNIPQGLNNEQQERAKEANGLFYNNTLWINKNSERPVQKILGHELTHYGETQDFINGILDSNLFYDFINEEGFANVSEYKKYLKEKKGYKDNELDSEMAAHFAEEVLFGNEKSINRLARENSTLTQKILNWLSDLRIKLVGTSQEKELLKIENMYRKALDQARNTASNTTDVKYNIKNIAEFDENEYNNIQEMKLSPKEYGKLAHIVDTDPSIKPGLNRVTTSDATYVIYQKEYNDFKVVDKYEGGVDNDTIANGNIRGIDNARNGSGRFQVPIENTRNEGTTKSNDELLDGNKGARSVKVESNNDGINNKENVAGKEPAFSMPEIKEKQLEIILTTNPMNDDYHVGIRNIDDIKTFDEVIDDDESFVWGDFSKEDAIEALEKGEIKVYSSKEIKNGNFVSTSYNQAKDYAGSGKIHSKIVPLEDVAWISGDEGQYAKVTENPDIRYSMNPVEVAKNTSKSQESSLLNEIAPIDDKKLESVEEKETTASILTKSPKRPAKDLLKQSVDVVMRKLVDAGNTINTVGKLTGDKHLYEYFNNTKQARQSAEYMIGEAQTDIKGNRVGNSLIRIFEEVRSKGDAYTNEFFEYLLHMHNIDRMAQNKPVFGASVTAEDSRKIANQLLEKHPEFEKQANKVYAYNRNLMQWRVDSGLISKEQADLMNEMYPHYVPTFRDVSGTSGSRAMQGTVQIANTVRKATGSNKDIMPIDASMARQTMQTIQAAKRNLLGNRLLNDALNNKDKVGEYIQAVEKTTEQNDLETELDTPKDTNLDSNNNVFKIFRNGETYVMQVNNGIYEGLKSISSEIDNTDAKLWLKPVKAANTAFKQLITGYSPMFTIRNFARDIQDAGLYSKNLRGFLKKYPKAYQEMMGNGKMWQLYKSLGGTGSSFFDYETGIEKTLDTQNKTSTKIKEATLGKVEELNMMIEQAPRFAEFMATIEKAGNQNYDTLMEAMLNAADVTVNFGRSGTVVKEWNSTFVPFLNPSIQGFDKLTRTVLESKDGKKAAKLILRASLLGILPSVLNELLYSDDDEYENLTDRDKDTNFLIKLEDNKWIKIPKGRVLSIFGNTATRALRTAKGEEWDFGEYAKNQASQTAPISVFDSNLYSPIQAVQNNKTWYGSDIVPQRLQDYAPKDQYDENTDVFSKWLGGKINYSPKKINYLIDAYTGIIGDVVLPLTTPKAETNPFTKAFVLDGVTSNEISNDFYNMLDKYNPKQNPKKSAKEVSRYLNKQSSQVSDIYKQIREVENSDISDDEKRKQVRELRELANTIELTAMATVPEYEKAVDKYRGTFADEDVDSDYAYLFANRDIFGAEYAVKTFSKALYNNHKNENMDTFFKKYFTKQYFQKKIDPKETKSANSLPTLAEQRAKLPTLKK